MLTIRIRNNVGSLLFHCASLLSNYVLHELISLLSQYELLKRKTFQTFKPETMTKKSVVERKPPNVITWYRLSPLSEADVIQKINQYENQTNKFREWPL